jgi:hypothetical protein
VRIFSRRPALRLIVSLLLATSLHIVPSHANGVDKMMTIGQPASGSVAGKGADIYKIEVGSGDSLVIQLEGNASASVDVTASNAGNPASLADIAPAAGPTSGASEVIVYTPSGDYAGKLTCAVSCNLKLPVTGKGVWKLVVLKRDQDEAAGQYTLSVNEQG